MENTITQAAVTEQDIIRGLLRTWNVIAGDIFQCGGPLTGVQVAETCADYLYSYADRSQVRAKEISKAVMSMPNPEFKKLAKKVFPAKRYS